MSIPASSSSDDEAAAKFLANLPGKPITDPIFLRFTGGRRKKTWIKNCVSVGLAGGFIEPLESTSIYLTQQAITALAGALPDARFRAGRRSTSSTGSWTWNIERVRDFVTLHYHATERDDTPMWNYVRTMPIPDTLELRDATLQGARPRREVQGGHVPRAELARRLCRPARHPEALRPARGRRRCRQASPGDEPREGADRAGGGDDADASILPGRPRAAITAGDVVRTRLQENGA